MNLRFEYSVGTISEINYFSYFMSLLNILWIKNE